MKKSALLFMSLLMLCIMSAKAQVVTTDPSPLQEDSQGVVIWFHADQGNKGLMGLTGSTPIYAHTGVSVVDGTGKETKWKYAPKWEVNEEKYALTYVSTNLWKLEIGNIREYYGVQAGETVTELCFVFRNANGSKEGKGEGATDIFVPVVDAGFQLAFRKSIGMDVIIAPTDVKFTASTTEEADINLYINDKLIASATGTKSLAETYRIESEGNYIARAEATRNGVTLSRSILVVYARQSNPATSQTVPPMGLTKNSDGTYTFCLAAPGKEGVMILGSWDGYKPDNKYVMDYVDGQLDGGTFRYFTITLPASLTGTEFGYYYLIDGEKAVGDPYARLVLDPQNDKYIPTDVYPNLPAYPTDLVPANLCVAWHSDNMLAYNWQTTNFVAPDKDNLVIYELLLRDFTGTEGAAKGNGNIRLAMNKLWYLKSLGINAIELLPINEFNGNISWGYNPNFYFAIDKAYGTPQDYKEFIDACHEAGIAVILDVVFNQSDWQHPWYKMYNVGSNPFFNATAPHAYSVLNDWNQGYPLVRQQWRDMLQFWLTEYKVDGFRFDLVKGLGNNDSYANSGDAATNAYNASRVANMKMLHDAMRVVNPNAYFINENLAGAKEEEEMAADGELNWYNLNYAGCQYAMGYSSGANLNTMWAVKASRTPGSTVAYLESHDEERLAYKQDQWGAAGVKGDHAVSMQRCGSAAAQMILTPGSHMIWMFSEQGNAQSTKDSNGGNNTSPKIVDWSVLNDPDNAGLVNSYTELINIRLRNKDMFAPSSNYNCSFTNWSAGRFASTTMGDREIYLVINPDIKNTLEYEVPFAKSDNSAYHVASKSYGSTPMYDAAAKKVAVEPNCYAVFATTNVSGVEGIEYDAEEDATMVLGYNGTIRVSGASGVVDVYSLSGLKVAAVIPDADGNAMVSLPSGLYLVRAGKSAAKVKI